VTRYYELILQLADVQELFAPPDFDPFDRQARFDSGIDRLIDDLKPTALIRKVRTTIVLPADRIEAGLENKIRGALERYCQHKIRQNQRELSSLRWKGVKALQNGLIFLAACLLLSTAAENGEFLPEFLRRFLGEGLLIVGWVSLWHPVEVLLYEWWSPSRENQLYNRLRQMDLIIKERP
jgi:hypothetical protein